MPRMYVELPGISKWFEKSDKCKSASLFAADLVLKDDIIIFRDKLNLEAQVAYPATADQNVTSKLCTRLIHP